MHLFLFSLQAGPRAIQEFAAMLSPVEAERQRRFKFQHLRDQFAVAHGITRQILGKCLGLPGGRIKMETAENGKPFLPGHPELQFNLSHSGNVGLLGVTLHSAIGVDIEVARPMPDGEKIAGQFFSVSERQALAATPAGGRKAAFFRCWTRKEAYIKATGQGLSMPLHSFDVSLDRDAGFASEGPERDWTLRDVSPSTSFIAAVAVQSLPVSWHFWRITSAI